MVKRELRKRTLQRLRTYGMKNRYAIDKKITNQVKKLIDSLSPQPKSILLYLPLPIEVDLRRLIYHYRRKGIKLFVPKIQKESFNMVEYRLPLEENSLKIQEPKSKRAHKKVDLIIVPVVAMDSGFGRVGFGKGMYDRFFDTLHLKPTVIFIQRIPCMTRQHVCDPHDIRGDFYISSKEILIAGKRYGRNIQHYRRRARWRTLELSRSEILR